MGGCRAELQSGTPGHWRVQFLGAYQPACQSINETASTSVPFDTMTQPSATPAWASIAVR
jgi:hypothetical protein